MSKIIYADKVALNTNTEIPAQNKVEDTDINNIKGAVNEIGKYNTATAGTNGDFKVTLKGTLSTNDIVYISFPSATNGSSNARLSIDNGTTYKNIKDLNNNQILASQTQSLYLTLRYNGTDFITDLSDIKIGGNIIATNEFVDGKRVYCKKINTGTVPNNSTRTTSTGLTNINIVKTGWFIYDSTGNTVVNLPYANPGAPVWSFLTDVKTSCKANVATNHGNLTGWESYLIIWFTYN